MVRDAFSVQVDKYDAWYDTPSGRALLDTEAACLAPLLAGRPRPYLEIGVGTGRFAGAMGVEYSLSCPQGGDGTEGDIVSQNAALTAKIIDWIGIAAM